jgi:hypothetical protein
MRKPKEKVLDIRIHFVPDLVEKQSAYGLYYRLRKSKNVTDIYIDTNHANQLDVINTFYHEFTHFIVDVVLQEDNYSKFFHDVDQNKKVNVTLGEVESLDEQTSDDINEEKLCTQIANKCTAIVKKKLNIVP